MKDDMAIYSKYQTQQMKKILTAIVVLRRGTYIDKEEEDRSDRVGT